MEEPREPAPQEIADIDAIRNIDTARMALRWALERLHKIEQEKNGIADRLAQAEKALSRAVEEQAALQKTLVLRSGESDERELYYARLDEFLSLRLEGKLDPGELAKRELETEQLRALLDQKLAQSEKEQTLRRAALEREFKLRHEESERAVRDRARALEQNAEVRSKSLEQEHLSKLGEVREREIVLRQEEKVLAARQTHFEEYYSSQRAELQAQLKGYRDEVESQVHFRVQLAERVLDERQAALEAAWIRERALLIRELEGWKRKAQELAPRALEVQTALDGAEEAARHARGAADAKTLLLEEQRRGFEDALAEQQRRLESHQALAAKDHAALAAQRDEWRAKAEQHLRSAHDLAKGLSTTEERMEQLRAAAEREIAVVEERGLAAARRQEALSGEVDAWKKRHQDLLGAVSALEDRLASSEAAARQAGPLRTELDNARRAIQALQPRLLDLERDLSAKAEWDRERRLLLEDLDLWRAKASEALPQALEGERARALAEEAAAQAQAAADRLAARFEQQRLAWQHERRELLSEIQSLSSPVLGPKDP